jgi:hypothetical protein
VDYNAMRTFTAPKTWDGIKSLEEGNRDRWFASLPLQQIGQPEEVAERLMCWDPNSNQVGRLGKILGTICVANSLKTRTCRGR